MRIYWSYSSIPELVELPANEQKARWKAAYLRIRRHWLTWICLLICALVGGLGTVIGQQFGMGVYGALLAGAAGGLLYWQALISLARWKCRDVLLGRYRAGDLPPNA